MFLIIKILVSILIFKCAYCSESCYEGNKIIESINERVRTKYPNINVPPDWKYNVFIKYYSLENSIKVHCPRESDAPFGRALLRILFRVYKKLFPNDERVLKIKLSFQAPTDVYITAEKLSKQGYLKSIHGLVQDLPISRTECEIDSLKTPASPKPNISMISPSSLSETNSFAFPVYVFYSNDREKIEQEGMVNLLFQLGFNVIHLFGNPSSIGDISSSSLKVPELLSPKIESIVNESSHLSEINYCSGSKETVED
ncbi:hypothetical protein FG386_000846 [Cryptosporidium ryanae]|uniref:uncharacterized protein n=1 Tax=Cryptosporidium ryanae TaxID=515981 RepID=UPI00351A423E|nr:hypothetical protein FG386_000846 [Cryptosporidium ryanae]